jgi:hypothetical protein
MIILSVSTSSFEEEERRRNEENNQPIQIELHVHSTNYPDMARLSERRSFTQTLQLQGGNPSLEVFCSKKKFVLVLAAGFSSFG